MLSREEIAKVLPSDLDPAQVTDSLKIHASPGGPLGETVLVKYAARWLAAYRDSMLAEHRTVTLDSEEPCSLAKGAFRSELTLNVRDGEKLKLEISALDQDRVEAFLGVEEVLESVREAEERLSAPPGVAKVAPPSTGDLVERARQSAGEPDELLEDEPAPGADDDLTERDEEAIVDEVAALVEQGQLRGAIQRYRELTGAGQGEAEAKVRALAIMLGVADDEVAGRAPGEPEAVALADLDLDPRLEGELVGYLKMGHRAQAIARVRRALGAGMVEAQEIVDAVARAEGLSTAGAGAASSFWWPLFGILMALAVLLALFRFAE